MILILNGFLGLGVIMSILFRCNFSFLFHEYLEETSHLQIYFCGVLQVYSRIDYAIPGGEWILPLPLVSLLELYSNL